MTVLEKILSWSKELPPWESDALRRLFAQRELSDSDYDDLVALAKQAKGMPDDKGRLPSPLAREHVPISDPGGSPVYLQSLTDLKNVNALADSSGLKFAERGITVVYGDNASGKSGYVRVLKRACRARDDELVLPNATLTVPKRGVPEALLTVSRSGITSRERWVHGRPSPDSLSRLSVFDAHCARVYLDEESDIAYKPYGLDLVEDLGKACVKVRERIQRENDSIVVDLGAFEDLKDPAKTGSIVARLVSNLSSQTRAEDISALAALSDDERKRLKELDGILKEGNPIERAKTLRSTANRLSRLVEACDAASTALDGAAATRLRAVDETFVSAQQASDLLAKSLCDDATLLPGTGGQAWRDLLAAARTFSREAYARHAFPHVGPDAKCVLCQQDLAPDGKDRYRRFGEFLLSTATDELRKSKDNLSKAKDDLKRLDLSVPLMDDDLLAEIKVLAKDLAEDCRAFRKTLSSRRDGVLKAFNDHAWTHVPDLHANPAMSLRQLVTRLNEAANSLEESTNRDVRNRLLQEQVELSGREQFNRRSEALLRALAQLKRKANLAECASAIETSGISRKARTLTEEAVSEALAAALNREFSALGIDHLKVTFSTRVERGRPLQQLKLDFPGTSQISQILSEGEQRALAIASFLAEISLAPGASGLIFDDPVSSLDHLRREKVAARLVAEGARRQIVIFTHDLFFLGLLMNEAAVQQVPIEPQSVTRVGGEIGLTSPDLPFEGQDTKARIGSLKQRAQLALAKQRAGEHRTCEALVKQGYDLLRQAWERAIEEVLLQGVVQRFDKGVHTQKLSGVTVDDEDWREISIAMTRCSAFTGHDRPRSGGISVTDPIEFEADVLKLETFRKRIVTRAGDLRSARKVGVSPPQGGGVR